MTTTFVLLHGGGHGGWCFQPTARLLRQAGYDVYTPTLTGFGERVHLLNPDITFETHILDLVNMFEYEDLWDVVLVGHSLGGVLIPHIAERLPSRIRRVVWLDGVVLADGETAAATVVAPLMQQHNAGMNNPVEAIERYVATGSLEPAEMLMQDGTPEQKAWLMKRIGAHPLAINHEPGRLSAFLALNLPTGFIRALQSRVMPPEQAQKFVGRLPGCRYLEVDASHNLMLSRPQETTEALIEMAK